MKIKVSLRYYYIGKNFHFELSRVDCLSLKKTLKINDQRIGP